MNLEINMTGESTKDVHVELVGELDIFSSPELKKRCKKILDQGDDVTFTIDCRQLIYVDSTGLGVFMYLVSAMQDAKENLKLIHVRKNVAKLFFITKMDQFLSLEVMEDE